MSRVTNLILHIGISENEEELIKAVNKFWKDDPKIGLVSIDDPELPRGWYGGTKMFEANLYIGAYNYLNLEEFIKHLNNIDWEYPETVQIIVKEEDDSIFRIINLDGKTK